MSGMLTGEAFGGRAGAGQVVVGQLEPPSGLRPPLPRLVEVELRKMVDTRAGFWLVTATALLTATAVLLRLTFGDRPERTLEAVFGVAQLPISVLLPVLGILSVTSEWSQRTALTTFSLVPRRSRVVAAKLFALTLLGLAGVLAAVLAAVAGFGVGGLLDRTAGGWSLPVELLGQAALYQVLNALIGVAFGMLLLSSAAAIVLFFVLPTVWSMLGYLVPALRTPAEWLDAGRTLAPLLGTGMTGLQWEQLATSCAAWVLLPLALGVLRLIRSEIK